MGMAYNESLTRNATGQIFLLLVASFFLAYFLLFLFSRIFLTWIITIDTNALDPSLFYVTFGEGDGVHLVSYVFVSSAHFCLGAPPSNRGVAAK